MADPSGDCKDPILFYLDPYAQNPLSDDGQWETSWSKFKSKFFSKPYTSMFVFSSHQPLQSGDLPGDSNQPGPSTGDNVDSVLLEEDEELREEIEQDFDECPEGTTLVNGVDCIPVD